MRTGQMGGNSISFVFDDVTQQLVQITATITTGLILRLLNSDTSVRRTILIPPGTFNLSLPVPQRVAYTWTDSFDAPGHLRLMPDGITPKRTLSMLHQLVGA